MNGPARVPSRPQAPAVGTLQRRRRAAFNQRGAQLLEFAFVLPFLAVLLVGITEFGLGFLLKQKLTNAAREGARLAVQMPMVDINEDIPETVQSVRNAIVEYLTNADVDTSSFDTDPTETAAREFTYYDGGGNAVIVIDRSIIIPDPPVVGQPVIPATRVTVRYPYTWTFSQVIQLLVPSASYSSTFLISADAEMKNMI